MGISLILVIILVLVTIPLIMCITRADRYESYVNAIDSKRVSGAKYLGVGFALMDILKIDFHKVSFVKKREQAGILFGKKYADFYLRVLYAQAFTYGLLVLYAMTFAGCLTGGMDGLLLCIMGAVLAGVVFYYYLTSYQSKIEKLSEEYMTEFPGAVSAIALLVNGGVYLRDAWRDVAFSSDKALFMQMRVVLDDMRNGYSEADAISMFADRCATKEIRKFASTIVQSISKGGRDLANDLVKQADSLLIGKRQFVLQQGEKASNKLMMPIMLIFLGIIIMIMMPIMSTMSI